MLRKFEVSVEVSGLRWADINKAAHVAMRSGFTSLDQSAAKLRWTVSLVMPPLEG